MPFHLSVLPLSIPRDFKNGFHVGENFCTGSAENEILLIAGGQVLYEQERGHFLCAPSCSCLQTILGKGVKGKAPLCALFRSVSLLSRARTELETKVICTASGICWDCHLYSIKII